MVSNPKSPSSGLVSTHTFVPQTPMSPIQNLVTSPTSMFLQKRSPASKENESPLLPRMTQMRIWGLGRLATTFFLIFLVSALSSSGTCMSLGGEAPLQFQELRPIPIQQQQLEPISDRYVDGNVAEVGMKEDENESLRNYEIPSQSQLFLPSLFKSSMVEDGSFRQHQQRFGQEQKMETNENQKVNTSPRFQQHQHLQKLQQNPKDLEEDGEGSSSKADWETVIDPHLYLLTEWNSNPNPQQLQLQQQRMRRNSGGPSLSIVNPLDVLRQRLLLEIARRKMRQSQNQIMLNADLLQKIGRRRRR